MHTIIRSMLTACLLLAAVPAMAAPFLVCDPYPMSGAFPTVFQVSVDGGAPVDSFPVAATGGVILKYDLAGLTQGQPHTITVKACNLWGCSEASSIGPFTPAIPGQPGKLAIVRK